MGFFGRLKRVALGAVSIEVTVPPTFSWSSEMLPVTVSLTNDDDDERTVRKIEVELEKSGATSGGQRPAECEVKLRDEIVLAPGQTVTLDIPLPLRAVSAGLDLDVAAWASAQGLPEWVSRMVVKGFDKRVSRVPMTGRHALEVEVNLTTGRVIEKTVRIEAV